MHSLNPIIKLLADNRQTAGRRFEVRALADTDAVEIYLYDAIVEDELTAEWWGGIAPQSFVRQLRDITAGTIHLRINSPGGSVFAARAIEAALREHKARVVVHIDGLAASAASFIAMAGDEIVIAKGAMIMIHKGWTYAYGNADDLGKTVALLNKVDGTLVQTYADRTGQSAEQLTEWMAAETWFTAEESIEHGFADSIAGDDDEATPAAKAGEGAQPSAHLEWNLKAYLHGLARKPAASAQPPAASEQTDDHRHRQQQRMRVQQLTASRIA